MDGGTFLLRLCSVAAIAGDGMPLLLLIIIIIRSQVVFAKVTVVVALL